jgi:hypothetical protein
MQRLPFVTASCCKTAGFWSEFARGVRQPALFIDGKFTGA